jgi:D-3-phosphoglycerate dehydrogenase
MNIIQLEPISIKEDFKKKIQQDFSQKGHEITFYETKPETDKEKINRAKEADILIVSNLPLSKNVLEQCKNLKMISVAFAGVDHIDMNYCQKNNILVSNAADYSTISVAELTVSMIISLYRRITWGDTATRQSEGRNNFLGKELFGKTVGLIGLGRIGQQVAKYVQGFGCKTIAYNRSPKNIPGIEQKSLKEVLQQSDIVSIHIPLTIETKGLLNKEELSLMKKDAILVNTARGPIVDYSALAEVLNDKQIGGAALDVYEKEPPIDQNHPILAAPNTLLLPHLGFATEEAIEKRSKIIIDNINKWLNNEPQNVI